MRASGGTGAALVVATATTLMAMAAVSQPVQAYGRGYAGPPVDHVVAHSRWGHGSVSGPVRPTPRGWQVRLPRGTWIDCVRSCSETLRRQTVDFWESNGPQSKDDGPGYFRWDFYLPW